LEVSKELDVMWSTWLIITRISSNRKLYQSQSSTHRYILNGLSNSSNRKSNRLVDFYRFPFYERMPQTRWWEAMPSHACRMKRSRKDRTQLHVARSVKYSINTIYEMNEETKWWNQANYSFCCWLGPTRQRSFLRLYLSFYNFRDHHVGNRAQQTNRLVMMESIDVLCYLSSLLLTYYSV
jgi:hypothetical protein